MAAPHKAKLTEVVVSSKAIPVFGGTADINTGDTHSRRGAQPLFGRGVPASGILRSNITGLLVEMAGSGTAGTAPNINDLYKMCGLDDTIVAGTSVTYGYLSSAPLTHTSSTIGVFQGDAIQQDLANGCGDLTITGEAGKPLMCSFDFIGTWTAPSENSSADTLATSADAPILKASTLTLDGDDLVWRTIEIALNNVLTERPDISATNGIASPIITDRDNRIKLVAEVPDFSTANYWTDWNASTKLAFNLVVGATAGNIITITCDIYIGAAPIISETDGIYLVELDLEISEIAADNPLAIAFT